MYEWNKNTNYILIIMALLLFVIVVFHPPLPPSEPEKETSPYPYCDHIEDNGKRFGLEPALIAAVIENESAFDKDRVSPEGAVGLMQILPSTAEQGAEEIGMNDFSKEQLFQPCVNITIGTWYLTQLLKQFSDDKVAALAAYNAGPARVKTWKNTSRWQQEEGIHRIPLMETRSYVKLVIEDLYKFRSR